MNIILKTLLTTEEASPDFYQAYKTMIYVLGELKKLPDYERTPIMHGFLNDL